MTLTKEQLQHLAKLAAIKIDNKDEEQLLPQIDKIIEMVEKLNACDLDWVDETATEENMQCNWWLLESLDREDFLINAKHARDNGTIWLDVSTNE